MPDDLCVSMEIPPDTAFACPAAGAAQTLAKRSGFGQRESFRFQLTVEEFCLCLIGLVQAKEPLRVAMTGKRYLLRSEFTFRAAELSLGGLNITAHALGRGDGEPSRDLGLLLAGNAADRFHLEHQGGERFRIVAEVDRRYPELTPIAAPEGICPPYRLELHADAARLCQAAALAASAYPPWQCPGSFHTPEQFADLVADGQVACVCALDAAGQTVGLLTWNPCSSQALYFSGPFVFTPAEMRPDVARLLLDGFLEAVARERYAIVLGFRATGDLLPGYFEPLGSLQACAATGCDRQPVVFRHLREDAGLAVWCSPRIENFLRETYERLAMPRDILPVEAPAGRPRRESLLGTAFDRCRDLAELRPFLDGQDMAANLAAHVAAIREKGIHRILYYMDLARSWEAALADDLLQSGFSPKVVLPHGGQGDMVVWQHDQDS
ncbi:hypothetical protein [Desulfovibrio sp. TomC]|uniref:hypothetical protein n=1 Tax=Desulfovibrio sp. TomC TaxID=1562888 RepID=UPI0005743356|nr:hypothetical protein [Desulfovibrio sp. TomC]KHK03521.1 hypothetical protein NY78_1109 [Desulfovibrio sp. TomC]